MGQQATLSVRIWTEGRKSLPDNYSDLSELFAPHVSHIAEMCEQGCTSGDVCPDGPFRGWWKIAVELTPRKKSRQKEKTT